MGVILRQATTMPVEDKRAVEERLNMYDELMEQDPKMQRLRAEWEALGESRGEVKGEVKALQNAIITVVDKRFPTLAEFAQKQATQLEKKDVLNMVFKSLITAPDERIARAFLENMTD